MSVNQAFFFKQWHLKFWTKILLHIAFEGMKMHIFSIKENLESVGRFWCLDLYFNEEVQV